MSALLSYASSAPEPLFPRPSALLHRCSAKLCTRFTFLLCSSSLFRSCDPVHLRYVPFATCASVSKPLERPREPNTGHRLLRVSPSRSIFTIFTSRPGNRTAYKRTSRTEEKETSPGYRQRFLLLHLFDVVFFLFLFLSIIPPSS